MRTQKRCLGYVAIVVDDYDRAIAYYTQKLGFTLVEDTPQPGKRWVVVSPNPKATAIYFWRALQTSGRKGLLVISVAGGGFYSCKPMISGAITTP